jgi:hypothetical protein
MVINHLRNRLFTDTRTLPDSIGQLLECLQEAQYYELGALQRTIVSKLKQLTVVSPLVFLRFTPLISQTSRKTTTKKKQNKKEHTVKPSQRRNENLNLTVVIVFHLIKFVYIFFSCLFKGISSSVGVLI